MAKAEITIRMFPVRIEKELLPSLLKATTIAAAVPVQEVSFGVFSAMEAVTITPVQVLQQKPVRLPVHHQIAAAVHLRAVQQEVPQPADFKTTRGKCLRIDVRASTDISLPI